MKVRAAHLSLQFSDTDKQHTFDIEKLADRAVARRYAWVTGTESGPGADNTAPELVRVFKAHGYRPWVPSLSENGIKRFTDCWLAVREDLIDGGWKQDFRPAIPGSEALRDEMKLHPKKRWAPKGLVTASFDNRLLGNVNVGTAHYLTDARNPSSPFWKFNKDLANVIGDWAEEVAKGKGLAFYAGDQNMADNKNNEPQGDTFFGNPLTTAWDEMRHWENTGHGNIDVIASYNRDKRVRALDAVALDDKEFFLHGDHYLIEATYRVDPVNDPR